MFCLDWLHTSLSVYPRIFLSDWLRYLIPATIAFTFFYILARDRLRHRKIQAVKQEAKQYRREFFYSMLSAAVFALVGLGMFWMIKLGLSQVYNEISANGIPYFALSIAIALVIHDTYFYWTHRLLHTRFFFRYVHRIHHQSTAPSPWAAYAFHPIEALIQGLIGPILISILPIHPAALGIFLAIQIVRNVLGHSGYEIFPRSFANSGFLRLFQSNTEHDLHHRFTKGNYALYFTWWDRLLSTDRADFLETFRKTTRSKGEAI
ncbi:hypothetical protein CH373_01390 [Leptospira perolatii]|uniref:Fatty acid hydroxylase domain-containing protein n=1 Tax=Leptospira perolatii TaxID=2023191 RepID=A0A2M9ZRM0_9LEPT|nr:sterol desaturase family protein [Leptospira perolatii]PJZ71195.1 hypothetical protein CH360_01390 [Leptospira perolatii]PJZ74728.1 hypothetical protein CH373_01390 [Leptospira perolatii]